MNWWWRKPKPAPKAAGAISPRADVLRHRYGRTLFAGPIEKYLNDCHGSHEVWWCPTCGAWYSVTHSSTHPYCYVEVVTKSLGSWLPQLVPQLNRGTHKIGPRAVRKLAIDLVSWEGTCL